MGKRVIIGSQKVIKVYVQEWDGRYGRKKTLTVMTDDINEVFEVILKALRDKYEGKANSELHQNEEEEYLNCPKCGGMLVVMQPSSIDVDLYNIRCEKCGSRYLIDADKP